MSPLLSRTPRFSIGALQALSKLVANVRNPPQTLAASAPPRTHEGRPDGLSVRGSGPWLKSAEQSDCAFEGEFADCGSAPVRQSAASFTWGSADARRRTGALSYPTASALRPPPAFDPVQVGWRARRFPTGLRGIALQVARLESAR